MHVEQLLWQRTRGNYVFHRPYSNHHLRSSPPPLRSLAHLSLLPLSLLRRLNVQRRENLKLR